MNNEKAIKSLNTLCEHLDACDDEQSQLLSQDLNDIVSLLREQELGNLGVGLEKARAKRARAKRLDRLIDEFLEQPDVTLDDAADFIEALEMEVPRDAAD